jgi:hypothetical protein
LMPSAVVIAKPQLLTAAQAVADEQLTLNT